MLALMDMPPTGTSGTRAEVLGAAARALSSAIRDTDAVGWYQQGLTVGVIFTLLNHASKAAAQATIHSKVMSVLAASARAEQSRHIRVSYYFFPQPENGNADHPELYPDAGIHHAKRSACIVKRTMDVGGSLLLLFLFSPVLAIIAILVKLSSPGPALFRQMRIGQYGKPFTFLKFRSMRVNNDASIHRDYVTQLIAGKKAQPPGTAPGGVFKIVDDPRVTRIGRWLRRSSLDELPQLVNVLKGEMALIGPRPPLPYEFEKYEVWHRRRLMEVRPGITGLWQVSGRSKTTFDQMVRLDLQYARTWSIWLDIKILLRTPAVVLSGDGAY